MASHRQGPGEWQGTAMVPANEALSFFAFINAEGGDYETWTEPVLAWVMAQHRSERDEIGTAFYGLAVLQVDATGVNRRPEICEDRHDERGCHIGYTRGSLAQTEMPAWNAAALEHLKRCQRRKEALGG